MSNMFPEFSSTPRSRGVPRGRRSAKPKASRPVTLQQVRDIVRVAQEYKFFDSKVYATAISNTGSQYALSAVPQGDTDSTRDGDQINLHSIELKVEAYLQGTGGTNDFTNQVRLILYQWHPMSTGSQPTVADILQDSASVAQSPTMSNYKWDNRKDYTIVLDRTCNLSGNGPSDEGYYFKKLWKVPGMPAHFSNGSTTLQSNGLFLYIASDSLVATHPIVNVYARCIYSDA